jgi:hypothetical protein
MDCIPNRLSEVYPLAVLAGLEEVKLRPTVCLGVKHLGVFFLLEIFFPQLRGFLLGVALSDERTGL